jgi:hypothetical protein
MIDDDQQPDHHLEEGSNPKWVTRLDRSTKQMERYGGSVHLFLHTINKLVKEVSIEFAAIFVFVVTGGSTVINALLTKLPETIPNISWWDFQPRTLQLQGSLEALAHATGASRASVLTYGLKEGQTVVFTRQHWQWHAEELPPIPSEMLPIETPSLSFRYNEHREGQCAVLEASSLRDDDWFKKTLLNRFDAWQISCPAVLTLDGEQVQGAVALSFQEGEPNLDLAESHLWRFIGGLANDKGSG